MRASPLCFAGRQAAIRALSDQQVDLAVDALGADRVYQDLKAERTMLRGTDAYTRRANEAECRRLDALIEQRYAWIVDPIIAAAQADLAEAA